METATTVHQKNNCDELTSPGDFCIKDVPIASDPQKEPTKVYSIIMNCPICNMPQVLPGHKIVANRITWKTVVNKICRILRLGQPFPDCITIKPNIGCAYVPRHRYSITDCNVKLL